ncbi:hypothetical protein [Dolichospermum circinale]|uniref:hypothetical protein n=1 Tax=Dolichospermum circinale TaxID=109265 RepID=UPI00040DD219|nr:hypothetical protein [Dolichospermum circinale]MDB9484001.1 hypothetical protein [Dolichospermum circinale CS-537/05]MDB9453809.1 hypothetical protein [Dolichospermum circinale CS-541/06]MDB9462389.1 hypothetical protein [Dolichospermum circinale CS-541/04]MDB9475995.1 hypothetical protein [Dolichospermum circinale CS-537/11]MDB9478997.1 hypothetical protein [Dolichospermum circinale CS-537/03]
MKKSISPIAVILSCVSLIACASGLKDTFKEEAAATVTQNQTKITLLVATQRQNKQAYSLQSETEQKKEPVGKNLDKNKNTKKGANQQPKEGRVKEIVNGDLMCYVTLVDNKGIQHNVGASFEICDEKKFLNKKVRVTYKVESVNDCQSAEPCGKTRKQSIITKMEVVNKVSQKDSYTLSNGKWKIAISNSNSWNGVNGTGNVSYQGCNANGKCVSLTGGKVVCRDGVCRTVWKGGNYTYILEQPITENGNADSTLTVRKGKTEVLKVTGLKAILDR